MPNLSNGTTSTRSPVDSDLIETADPAPRMERLVDVGFFGGDVGVGLEKVRTRLLDLSKRNRLLNFKHPKSCLRVIDELPDQIFRKLIEGKSLSINPVPNPNPETLADEVRERLEQLRGPELLKYVAEKVCGIDTNYELPEPDPDGPAEARHTDNYLQAYQFPEPLEATVSSLSRAAKLAIEETGSNMCYLAFGFLEWFEIGFPDKGCLAPLMLVPISVSRGDVDPDTSTYRYQIRYSEEDLMPNLSLIEMLRRNFGIALAPLPELQEADGYESVEDYWAKCQESISTQPSWKIHRFVSASLFQFQKLLMYLDLDAARWPSDKSILSHEKIRALFEGSAGSSALIAEDYQIDELTDTAATLEIVEDADSSQMSALIDAHQGRDLVIEGPPGTGKSQTITNLIAASLAAGKSVLFVSEKLAALEVVKQRLSDAGLGDFCLELHSNKTNKLALLESLSQRLKLTVSPIQNMAQKLNEMASKKAVLRELSKVLDSRDPESGQTVQEIFVEAASLRLFSQNHLRHEDFERLAKTTEATPTYARLSELHDHLTDLMSLHGQLNSGILEHPWRAIGKTPIDKHSTDIIRLLEAASEDGAALLAALAELSSLCNCELVEDFKQVQTLVDTSAHFDTSGIDIWHSVVPAASAEKAVLEEFQQNLRNHLADRCVLTQTFSRLEAEGISSNESLASAVERLFVDFRGCTLPRVEQVISAIKEICDLLDSKGDLLTNIQTTFALPSIEDQRWLTTIQAALESVAVAPKDSLPLRSFALASPEALFVLQEAKERRASIEALKAELRKEFHLDLLPQRDELLEAKRTLADTGLFSIFSSRWRRAYHTHRSLCVSKPRKWTSSAACADIDRLLEMQRQTEEFNSDHQYQSKLGSHFSGLATNFDKLISVAQWLADIKVKTRCWATRTSITDVRETDRDRSIHAS